MSTTEPLGRVLRYVLSILNWVYLNIKPSKLLVFQTALLSNGELPTLLKYLNPSLEWFNLFSIPLIIFLIYTYRLLRSSMPLTRPAGAVGPQQDREVRIFTVFDGEGNVVDPGWLVWWGDVMKDKHGAIEQRWTIDPQKLTREKLEERRKWRKEEREGMEKKESGACLCTQKD